MRPKERNAETFVLLNVQILQKQMCVKKRFRFILPPQKNNRVQIFGPTLGITACASCVLPDSGWIPNRKGTYNKNTIS